jgi:hypothetical protein
MHNPTNIHTQEAIVTDNQLLFRGKEVNNMSKPNCSFDLHLCLSIIVIRYFFLEKKKEAKHWIVERVQVMALKIQISYWYFYFGNLPNQLQQQRANIYGGHSLCISTFFPFSYLAFDQLVLLSSIKIIT